MKFRIIAIAVVLAVLAGLWFAAQLLKQDGAPTGRPDNTDIRSLRIN